MNGYKINRKIHYWISFIVLVPLLVMAGTGVLLMLKKQIAWVQPPTVKGVGKEPTLTFDEILEVSKKIPEADIESWKNISRLDVRPGKGLVKVRAKNDYEIQVDLKTGKILNVDLRRSDLIESIHDGSFFHKHVKFGYFLPSAILLIALCATGLYLFYLPFSWKKRKKKRGARLASTSRPEYDEKPFEMSGGDGIKKAA